MLPTDPPATIDHLEVALNNLALAATNNAAVLQQLTVANLALTNTVAALTATNKKLVDAAATRVPATPPGTGGRLPGSGAPNKPFKGNYCWTHGNKCSKLHTSATCLYPAAGHCKEATLANTYRGSVKDKGWDT